MKARALGPMTALSLSLLAAQGCSGDKFSTRTETWGDVGSVKYEDARPEERTEEKKLTAREYAARFASGAECEVEARRTLSLDERGGIALFRACLEREDFDLIEPFYAAPWRQHLSAEDHLRLAHVVARRGGWVSEDIALLQQNDVDIYALAQAVEQPEQARGKTLLARLRYIEPRQEVAGQLVFEEATLTPDEEDIEDESPGVEARFPTSLTGQRVLLEVPGEKRRFRNGDELIVIGDLLGLEPVLNRDTGEDEEWAVVRVQAHFVPEVRERD